jgi:protein-disulfide isomerase
MTLIVLLVIFACITVSVHQAKAPLILRIVSQQSEMIDLLMRIDRSLIMQQKRGSTEYKAENIKGLEQQLVSLGEKVDALSVAVKNIQTARPPRRPAPPQEDYSTVHEIPVAHSPVRGKKGAPITIVSFEDFQCPFCARFHPAIKEVLDAYPDKVNFIIKHFPLAFHKNARPAAKAAFAAGEQGKYWEMTDLLLENFKNLSSKKIQEVAKSLKLNMRKFNKALKKNDAKYEEWINADFELGQEIGVRGTPTFYLNGRKTKARNLAGYKKEIDAILNKKK